MDAGPPTRFDPILTHTGGRNRCVTSRSAPPRAPRRSNAFVYIDRQLLRTSLLHLRVHGASTTRPGTLQNDGVLTQLTARVLRPLRGRPRAAARRAVAPHACPACALRGCLVIGALLCRLMAAPRRPRVRLAQPSPRRASWQPCAPPGRSAVSARRRRAQARRTSCAKVCASGVAACRSLGVLCARPWS